MAEDGRGRKGAKISAKPRATLSPAALRGYVVAVVKIAETNLLLSYWFAQPLTAMELLLTLTFSASALLLAWMSFVWPLGPFLQSCKGEAPPFVGVVATIFGLMVTFLSQDIWESNRQARRAINQEHDQLLTLRAFSKSEGALGDELRGAIRDYVNAVVGLEWRTMENGEDAPEAEAALDALTRLVTKAKVDQRFEPALVDTLLRLRSARETRLSIANAFPDDRKWTAVFLLAFLTQIGIAATHLERARSQLLAQAIFAAAAVVSMSLVASVEKPFSPPDAASAEPLAAILALIPEP